MTRLSCLIPWLALLVSLAACAAMPPSTSTARVLRQYPHDPAAFTEGLLIRSSMLYESTGHYGHSTLRRVNLDTGKTLARIDLADRYFGEGLTWADHRLYQLTWRSHTGFVYDARTLARIGRFHYAGQGWGLTWDGQHLIMSDGSDVLRVIERRSLRIVRRIHVIRNGRPVDNLNELEYIDGDIWANIWLSDQIVRIDPGSGRVVGVINTHDLRRHLPAGTEGVLNGIAFDATHRRLFVTGKNWPLLFQLAYPATVGEIHR